MITLTRMRRSFAMLAIASCLPAACALSAQTASLEEKSPFLPKGYGEKVEEPPPRPVVATNGPISQTLEFRSVMKWGPVYQFSLFDKRENKGYWLKENETEDGISVRNFDRDNLTVTVTMNGRSERLTLMSANDSPMPVASSIQNPLEGATAEARRPSGSSNESNRRTVIPRRRVILPRN